MGVAWRCTLKRSVLRTVGLVLGVGLGLLLLGVGAGIIWWQRHAAELSDLGKAAMRAGDALGRAGDGSACEHEAVARLQQLGWFEEATNKTFLDACVRAAARAAQAPLSTCAGIPPRDDRRASAAWARQRCAVLGRDDAACARLIGAVQRACADGAARPTPALSSTTAAPP